MARRIIGRNDVIFLAGLRRANSVARPRKPISDRMRETMISEFSDDVRLLARLTGRDLSAWLKSPPDSNQEPEATQTDPGQ